MFQQIIRQSLNTGAEINQQDCKNTHWYNSIHRC